MALDTMFVVAATYDNEADALADYEDVKRFYQESDLLDTYDAAVVAKEKNGKVKIIKKHEEPTRHGAMAGLGLGIVGGVVVALFPAVALGGALLLGGAGGAAIGAIAGHVTRGMPRGDLKELGELLDDGQSGMIVVAATDISDRVQQSLRRANKVARKELKADSKQMEKDINQAGKARAA